MKAPNRVEKAMKNQIVVAVIGAGVACAAGGYLLGSNGAFASASKSTIAAPVPKVADLKRPPFDGSSPDNFIKSWWAYMDYTNAVRYAECLEAAVGAQVSARRKIALEYFKQAVTPAAEATFPSDQSRAASCVHERVTRDISSVKVETETRSVILATLRNTTPVPPGVVASESDLEARQKGIELKYLLEKVDGKWRLAQIYSSNLLYGLTKDGAQWQPQLRKLDPSVPTFVVERTFVELN